MSVMKLGRQMHVWVDEVNRAKLKGEVGIFDALSLVLNKLVLRVLFRNSTEFKEGDRVVKGP